MGGWVVGWVAGLNENTTNSSKLGLTGAEFGNRNKKSGRRGYNTGSGEDLKTQLTLAEVWKNMINKAKKHYGELDEK